MPRLEQEGLTAHRLAEVARRVRRSEAALETVVDAASERSRWHKGAPRLVVASQEWRELPAEIRCASSAAPWRKPETKDPFELGKLETLVTALAAALGAGAKRFRLRCAGAMVSLQNDRIIVEKAPARRHRWCMIPKSCGRFGQDHARNQKRPRGKRFK